MYSQLNIWNKEQLIEMKHERHYCRSICHHTPHHTKPNQPYRSLIEGADEGNAHGVHIAQPVDGWSDVLRRCRVRGSSPDDGLPHESFGGVCGRWLRGRRRNGSWQMRGGRLKTNKILINNIVPAFFTPN